MNHALIAVADADRWWEVLGAVVSEEDEGERGNGGTPDAYATAAAVLCYCE